VPIPRKRHEDVGKGKKENRPQGLLLFESPKCDVWQGLNRFHFFPSWDARRPDCPDIDRIPHNPVVHQPVPGFEPPVASESPSFYADGIYSWEFAKVFHAVQNYFPLVHG
jgi:hypothetical protein